MCSRNVNKPKKGTASSRFALLNLYKGFEARSNYTTLLFQQPFHFLFSNQGGEEQKQNMQMVLSSVLWAIVKNSIKKIRTNVKIRIRTGEGGNPDDFHPNIDFIMLSTPNFIISNKKKLTQICQQKI